MRVGAITATVPQVPAAQPRRCANQHQVLHGRRSLIQAHHHAHFLLAAVHVSVQQFHQPLLGLQGQQHLAQPLAILFGRDQVRDPVHKNRTPLSPPASAPLRHSSSTEVSNSR
jgi:hypothetical protein